jgi:ATP/maltotriose-dependent transcriptional regulator MalT/DNA-binding SARP family transcriptional activator
MSWQGGTAVPIHPVSLAKTTRPSLAGVIARERLLSRLDQALSSSVVWLTGPPGCGKTTLAANFIDHRTPPSLWYQLDEGDGDVASFFYYLGVAITEHGTRDSPRLPQLTPEYHAGLLTFTRRYFQTLYQQLGASFVIVFDGYHEVSAQSAFHEVMRIALAEVPPGGAVMLISRSDPPAAMARLRANRAMDVIGWRDLRLTQEETNAIVARRGREMSEDALVELYEKTQGWAAGLILMLEQAPAYDALAAPADLSTPELVFDYLAGEILQKTDASTRELMLATAYLPQMTSAMVERLTGNKDAGAVLAELYRNNYFVTQKQARPQPVYQYHPLMREFLLARANEAFDKERRTRLKQLSADLLLAEGQAADAMALLREVGDWPGIVQIIESHASAMLDRGMGETLAQWVNVLPKEVQQQNPWTLYWLAGSRISISPRESRLLYEQAFELFKAQREPDIKGLSLACAGAMDAILFEFDDFSLLDRWIAEAGRLLHNRPEPLPVPVEVRVASSLVASMIVRQPHHPDLESWVGRAYAASITQTDPNLRVAVEQRVALAIAWGGHFPKAWQVIQGMRAVAAEHDVSPFVLTMLKVTEATYFMLTAQPEACLASMKEGLEIERASGVRVLTHQLLAYGAGGALASGDIETAEKLLEESSSLPGRRERFDDCYYHFLSTWLALCKHDIVLASQQQRLALTAATEVGTPFFVAVCNMAAAHVLHEAGEKRNVLAHFKRMHEIARHIPNRLLEFTGLMGYAYVALEAGRRSWGLRALRLALEIGKPRNYLSFLLWRPDMLARLCSYALEAGIEPEYVATLIRTRKLALDASRLAVADWPWQFRVHTLGQFRLLRNGEPLTFAGKAQRRPLDLLKVLIAHGGREVPEERITEALWPRIDGDSAHRSFTTTLHRLRRLLAEDRALQLSEGKLSLDGRYVWTDTWALEQIIVRIERNLRQPHAIIDADELYKLFAQLNGLYKGSFLGNEPDEPWSLPLRERLRHRFLRASGEACRYWQAAQPARAVEFLERALEVDTLAESLYRHLMVCYAQLGRRADAAETFERCRKILHASLGTEPSAETRAVYAEVSGRP